jgi:uncharacterized protein YbjT (DUF2867 family)
MIAVMGATGHTGGQIAELLLRGGERVRALGRSRSRLEPLRRAGAEVLTGDAADAGFLTAAFSGAKAVYTLLPTDRQSPDYPGRQRQEGRAIVDALRRSGVGHVVALSSLGADADGENGLIAGLHEQEERLKALEGVNVALLRPASFFENFIEQLAAIEQHGVLADSVAPDLAIPMVATRDIAEAAMRRLAARDWTGLVVRELLGPRDVTHREIARTIGARIGKPDLQYVQLSPAEMAGALRQAGFSAGFAKLYVEMTRAFNEGRIRPRAGRTPENTTPTRFEDFVAGPAFARQAV